MSTVTKHTLPNGLRLVAVEMPHLHSAELAVYLKVGGRNDPDDRAGLSHFLEHMLFRGTGEFPTGLDLELAFEAIGGSVNASTDEETTCYFSRVHPERALAGLDLFASMLMRPTLPGLETERQIITEESLDDLNEQGEEINPHNLTSRTFWPDHPLGRPTIGDPDSIAAIDREDLTRHMQRFYTPTNGVIVATGAIDAAAFFKAAGRAFGGWEGGTPPETPYCGDRFAGPRAIFVSDSDSQVHLQIAFLAFPRSDRRLAACRLIRRLLTGGGSSRLHLLLREKLGIVYSVDGALAAYDETGALTIDFSTAPDNMLTAIRAVLEEVARVADEPLAAAELQRVRQAYFYDLDYSRDSTYEMQVRYGWGELMDFVRDIDDDCREAAQVTPEALAAVARDLFSPRRLAVVAVGPVSAPQREAVEGLLRAYGEEL